MPCNWVSIPGTRLLATLDVSDRAEIRGVLAMATRCQMFCTPTWAPAHVAAQLPAGRLAAFRVALMLPALVRIAPSSDDVFTSELEVLISELDVFTSELLMLPRLLFTDV